MALLLQSLYMHCRHLFSYCCSFVFFFLSDFLTLRANTNSAADYYVLRFSRFLVETGRYSSFFAVVV